MAVSGVPSVLLQAQGAGWATLRRVGCRAMGGTRVPHRCTQRGDCRPRAFTISVREHDLVYAMRRIRGEMGGGPGETLYGCPVRRWEGGSFAETQGGETPADESTPSRAYDRGAPSGGARVVEVAVGFHRVQWS